MVKLQLRKPIYHEDCYECGGHWFFQWPLRIYKPRTLTESEREAVRIIRETLFMMQPIHDAIIRRSKIPWNDTNILQIPRINTTSSVDTLTPDDS